MTVVIRAIPANVMHQHQFGERFFSTAGMTWQQQRDLKAELVEQGCLVQEIYLLDPTQVLIERRVREELQAESEKDSTDGP
ncbi:hypothetical protein J7I84_08905 [Arthrobacter sp. ISL-85]|uniref:hypothetical protein n=1 Tax=Arthrobacter sp. ISL-85 TaxID=2819115 RepID=UPI001BED0446|nr:hypothetical protein [Arthrobacter sp. ISL-85]MBT2566611.1 hypothetical protein [Arthrobacter sp. ISL-85]